MLDIVVSEGFALAAPSEVAAGECIPGSTSLVNGEACTVRVLFTPSRRELLTGSLTISSPLAGAADLPRRELLTGSLTISSPLAGAAELPLAGRGIVPPLLAVESELDFGRVLRHAPQGLLAYARPPPQELLWPYLASEVSPFMSSGRRVGDSP